jgi:DUF4097 and DUF4098 domain-containing protein YvlB
LNLSGKFVIIIVVAAVAVIAIFGAYIVFSGAFAPLEQKEDKVLLDSTQNVDIQATTFNGDIVIQQSTGNHIEVIYNIETPKGQINEITTTTTNQTQDANSKIVAEAKIANSNGQIRVNYRATITIKVPSTSQCNLTLTTLNGNIIKPQLNDKTIVASTNNGRIDIKDDNATAVTATSLNGNVKISLVQGTLFEVDAVSSNGHVTYQDIALHTSVQTTNHLSGATTAGPGNLNLTLSSANGDVTVEYYSK